MGYETCGFPGGELSLEEPCGAEENRETKTMTDLEVVRGMKELLSGPKKWTKGTLAKTIDNQWTRVLSPDAAKFCLLGAYQVVLKDSKLLPSPLFYKAIGATSASLGQFNDHPDTAFQDIRDYLDRVEALALEQ